MAVRQPGATECGICSQGYAKILWETEERVDASAHGSRNRTKRMFVSMQSVNAFRAICLGNQFFCLIWHWKCIVSHSWGQERPERTQERGYAVTPLKAVETLDTSRVRVSNREIMCWSLGKEQSGGGR